MRIKFIFSISLSLCLLYTSNLHCEKPINPATPLNEIQQRMLDFSLSQTKDSLFYSLIGYFKEKGKSFHKVIENKIYFDERGFFYRLDLVDKNNNPSVSCVFFRPVDDPNVDRSNALNEHLCLCNKKDGSAGKVLKQGKQFSCGLGASDDEAENYSIDCQEFKNIQELLDLYYNKGFKIKNELQTIPIEVLELLP